MSNDVQMRNVVIRETIIAMIMRRASFDNQKNIPGQPFTVFREAVLLRICTIYNLFVLLYNIFDMRIGSIHLPIIFIISI